jgi:hypothetical protein
MFAAAETTPDVLNESPGADAYVEDVSDSTPVRVTAAMSATIDGDHPGMNTAFSALAPMTSTAIDAMTPATPSATGRTWPEGSVAMLNLRLSRSASVSWVMRVRDDGRRRSMDRYDSPGFGASIRLRTTGRIGRLDGRSPYDGSKTGESST